MICHDTFFLCGESNFETTGYDIFTTDLTDLTDLGYGVYDGDMTLCYVVIADHDILQGVI